MKSDIDIKDDIFKLLKGSKLDEAVTGVISKTKRPADSSKEDVVISILANENGQIQQAYINVNVYVQDVYRNRQYESNEQRLRELCKICESILEVGRGEDYRFVLESQRVLEVNGKSEHLINNKLRYMQCNS